MEPTDLTDEIITEYGEACYRKGNFGQWNLARSGLSGSPLEHRVELFKAIRAKLAVAITEMISRKEVSADE